MTRGETNLSRRPKEVEPVTSERDVKVLGTTGNDRSMHRDGKKRRKAKCQTPWPNTHEHGRSRQWRKTGMDNQTRKEAQKKK